MKTRGFVMILILKLSLVFYVSQAVSAEDKCKQLFSEEPAKEQIELEIADIGGKEGFIKKYKGPDGFLKLSQDLPVRMDYIYNLVSGLLTKAQMNKLGWQKFQGTSEEFSDLKSHLFLIKGVLKKEFIGMEGYALLADNYFARDMNKTYINVSAVLNKKEMNKLGWQHFQGTVEEFSDLKSHLFDPITGELKKEFIGIEGYASFSDNYFARDMKKTYLNVSAVLNKKEMSKLDWKAFHGTVEEFSELKSYLFDPAKRKLKEEFIGMEGYALLAKDYYKEDMQKTYLNVSAVLGKNEMNKLGWQKFQGTAADFLELRQLFDPAKRELTEEFKGMEGYALFADNYFARDMQKTYLNVSAVLNKKEMSKLDWQQFQGTVADFLELRQLFDPAKRELTEEFKGMEGYALFADNYFAGNMQKTYINVSAVLNKKEMSKLGWQAFQGTSEGFLNLRNQLFDPRTGELKKEFIGIEGYASFSDNYFGENMTKTYVNVSAVLGGVKIIKELGLGWKKFMGSTDQYRKLKGLFETKDIQELRDRKGQEYVAETIFNQNTIRTYRNVSALREELLGNWEDFKKLNWQRK